MADLSFCNPPQLYHLRAFDDEVATKKLPESQAKSPEEKPTPLQLAPDQAQQTLEYFSKFWGENLL